MIRACRLNRLVQTTEGNQLSLQEHLDNQPVKAILEIEVPGSGKTPARTARAELRFAEVALPRPQVTNAWIRQHAPEEPLPMRVIELIELDPPADGTPLHWVLYTSEPVETVKQAQQCIGYYAQRWGVEEYHKALKTGCRVESRYYETADRLERITGLLAIVAVQLLRMRSIARETPDRPAQEVVPTEWIDVLTQVRRAKHKTGQAMTIQQFLRHLAGLGGHLGRKCDGQPGWITLWRGLEKLLLILRGHRCRQARCG